MIKLSLCMIVRNEGALLARCLDSVKGIVDEIVVVDTGSDDETRSIATRFGARVFQLAWTDDFSYARNQALSHVTGDWVLVLDADETISAGDHDQLVTLIESDQADAYRLLQRTYGHNLQHPDYMNCGDDGYRESSPFPGWIPSRLVRLFRNDPDYQFHYRVHEVIEPSIESSGGVILDSKIPVHHFSYEKSPEFIDAKLQRYHDLGLRQMEVTPHDPKPCFEVALVCFRLKDYEKAEQLLGKAIELSPRDGRMYSTLGSLYLEVHRPIEAEIALRKAQELIPDDVEVLNKLASSCLQRGVYDEAHQLLERALKLAPDRIHTYNNRGLLFAVCQQFDKAIDAFQNALNLDWKNYHALSGLGMLYSNLGRYSDAQPLLEQALELQPGDARVLYHLAQASVANGQQDRAIELLKQAHLIQPQDPVIGERLRELT